MRRPPYDVPSRHDPVVATAARSIGGPVGRYAAIGTRGLAGVTAALLSMGALILALGVVQKGHCLAKGWVNPDQFWRACYSDIPVVHVTTGLAERNLPWTGASTSDQPLLSGLAMWLVARVSPRAGTDVLAQQWIFGIWAMVAMLLLAAAVLAAVALRPRRPWQAAHLAASPVLAVLALVATDLLGVALVMWALWAWSRSRPALAGALLGMAFLIRPFPLIFAAAIVLVGWREGKRREAVTVVVGALVAGLALYLPFTLAVPGTLTALRSWSTSSPGYGAPALIPQLVDRPLPTEVATGVALVGWIVALLLGGWLAFTARRPPGVVQVAAPMLLVVVFTAKSVPVQTGLWVLPLLALSVVPWRDHLLWAAAEIIHFEAVWLHIGFGSDAGKGLPPRTYALVVLLRMAAWVWVCWRVWDADGRDDEAVPAVIDTVHHRPDRATLASSAAAP